MAVAVVEATQKYVDALNEKFPTDDYHDTYGCTAGRKFDRIFLTRGGGQTVHAFVERETGKLLKAAGWKVPAKGARYDVSTPEGVASTVALADRYGSYLYQG